MVIEVNLSRGSPEINTIAHSHTANCEHVCMTLWGAPGGRASPRVVLYLLFQMGYSSGVSDRHRSKPLPTQEDLRRLAF